MDMDPFLHHYFSKNSKPTTLPRLKSENVSRCRVIAGPSSSDNSSSLETNESTEPKSLPLVTENSTATNNVLNSLSHLLPDDLLSPSTPIPINPSHFDTPTSSSTSTVDSSTNQTTPNLNRSRSFREISSSSSRSGLEKSQSFSSFLNSSKDYDEMVSNSDD